jgi:uridine phosphorylase
MKNEVLYHIGFGKNDLGSSPPRIALLSGDPERARFIAHDAPGVTLEKNLSENRGLNSYLACLPNGRRFISATSGMGAPSLSIVVNELVQVGVRAIIRVGTSGAIQADVKMGSIVITRAALCRQGAADDIAPREYPAAANPFLTMALVDAARELKVDWHIGVTASVDTFFEGQERAETSANKALLRALRGVTEEYRALGVLNYEMESGTLFKMGGVYKIATACVCAVIANRTQSETPDLDAKNRAVRDAIAVALRAAENFDDAYLDARFAH